MNTLRIATKADLIGAIVSIICLVHCLASPLLFFSFMVTTSQSNLVIPSWWELIDYVLLGISLIAILYSSKTSSKKWVQYTLGISWIVLGLVILNEKFHLVSLQEEAIFIPSISLAFFHLYSRKYCQCGKEECCVNE